MPLPVASANRQWVGRLLGKCLFVAGSMRLRRLSESCWRYSNVHSGECSTVWCCRPQPTVYSRRVAAIRVAPSSFTSFDRELSCSTISKAAAGDPRLLAPIRQFERRLSASADTLPEAKDFLSNTLGDHFPMLLAIARNACMSCSDKLCFKGATLFTSGTCS